MMKCLRKNDEIQYSKYLGKLKMLNWARKIKIKYYTIINHTGL